MKIYKASMMHHVTMLLVISSALAGVLMQSEDLPNGTPAPPRPKPAPKPLDPKRDHIDPADVFESKLYAQDGVPYQRFGSSLVQNDRLVAVSTDTSSGSPSRVYLFQQLNTTSFVEYAKLHSSSSDDGYGICMAMSERFLLVGAPYDDSTGYLSGRVYVYSLANAYSSSVSTEASTILESSSGYKLGGLYGSSVSILGDSIAVGAPMDSTFQQFSGAVFLYSYNAVDR